MFILDAYCKPKYLKSLRDVLELVIAFSADPAASVDDDPGRLDLSVRLNAFTNNICHARDLRRKNSRIKNHFLVSYVSYNKTNRIWKCHSKNLTCSACFQWNYQFVIQHRVVTRCKVSIVVDERCVLRETLFYWSRPFNQNRSDGTGHGDATLADVLEEIYERLNLSWILSSLSWVNNMSYSESRLI